MKYQVLSPEGYAINPTASYKTKAQAKSALKDWINSYKAQGHYTQVCYNGYRREISIDHLPDYCDIVAIN